MTILNIILSWLGAGTLLWRLWPRPGKTSKTIIGQNPPDKKDQPKISIIIPARNEAPNLPRLLVSLKKTNYPNAEIFLLDDQSTDQTAEIGEAFGVKVIKGAPLPSGWVGKNWACHQAVRHATGDYYLFTDADTEHEPSSLTRALDFLKAEQADFISALPFHRTETWWEKCLGPFHLMLLASTAPSHPKPNRLFSIGQYLLFSRSAYERTGGHRAIASQYPDDLALANACLKSGGRYAVHTGRPFFSVRMYDSLLEFIQGWRRNFLAGIQRSKWQTTMEVFLMFCALTAGLFSPSSPWAAAPTLASVAFLIHRQRTIGSFSPIGPLFFPFSLLLFVAVTALALKDFLTGNVLQWKGRSYAGWIGEPKAAELLTSDTPSNK